MKAEARKPVVIFDGSCGFCLRSLQWIRRLDRHQEFEYLPFQSDELNRRFPFLTREECEEAMHVILPDGRAFKGADAFRELFLQLSITRPAGIAMGAWPISWAARKVYSIVARNRHRLGPRGADRCDLPGKK